MPDMKCPLGEDCDLTLAYMAGAKDAKDTITRLRAENAKLRAALHKIATWRGSDLATDGRVIQMENIARAALEGKR